MGETPNPVEGKLPSAPPLLNKEYTIMSFVSKFGSPLFGENPELRQTHCSRVSYISGLCRIEYTGGNITQSQDSICKVYVFVVMSTNDSGNNMLAATRQEAGNWLLMSDDRTKGAQHGR